MTDDFEPTDVEQDAIDRAIRRLAGHDRDEYTMQVVAGTALRVLVAATINQPAADDPPIAAALGMPTWNAPSGWFPTVAQTPLLNLLEAAS